MKKRLLPICLDVLTPCLFCVIVMSFISCDSPDDSIDKYIEVHKVSDRIIVVTYGYDAVTAIKTQKGIVVIDAGISNTITRKIRSRIESELNSKNFVYLVNTHSHPDHTGGNAVFADAEIIAHLNFPDEMKKSSGNPEKIRIRLLKIADEYKRERDTIPAGTKEWKEVFCQECRYRNAHDDFVKTRVTTRPSVTFTDSLHLSLGDITADLFYFGKAHSESDILIHIPELKLLFTGDLFFTGGRPSLQETGSIEIERWEQSFQWLANRKEKIHTIIGGHGQIMMQQDLDDFIEIMERKASKQN